MQSSPTGTVAVMKRWPARFAPLLFALLAAACGTKRSETPAAAGDDAEPGRPTPATADEPVTPSSPEDPRGAAEAADLAVLCQALDHDYIDGTLSDYYGEVTPKTSWGVEIRDGGNEADLPGRHLEAAANDFVKATSEPMPQACTELFSQLEDLE